MLVFTPDQLQKLGLEIWENELLVELRAFAPRLSEIREVDCFRETIRLGSERAASHGFELRGPIRFYLQTMLCLGSHFDEDPQLPQLRLALEDDGRAEMERSRALFAAVDDYLEGVHGPRNQHAIAALARLRDSTTLWGGEPRPGSHKELEVSMLVSMGEIFPQKAERVGHATLSRVIEHATKLARLHELEEIEGTRVLCGLVFALGWGIDRDPMYPWVRAMLLRRNRNADYDRAQHLARQARIYLSATLDHLSQP